MPKVLLSGDHAAVARYRFLESIRPRTIERRPDLLARLTVEPEEKRLLIQEGLWDELNKLGAVVR